MTDKQFWMKLDQLNSSSISSELKAAKLFKQAATEGLSILVVGRKGKPERREIGEDLSFFLCYTSRKHAQEDRDNGGMWSTYPVSKMYEAILSDDKIVGIVLNGYSDQHIRFLTSTILKMEEKELESLSSYSEAKDLLNKGRALEAEIKDRIANGEIVPEETQDYITEHSRLLNDLESLLSTSTDRGDAPGK